MKRLYITFILFDTICIKHYTPMKKENSEKIKQFIYRNLNRFLVDIYCLTNNKTVLEVHPKLISVIMLSFNRVEDTIFSVKQLYKHTKLPFELIILDNNSDPDQKEMLKKFLKKLKNAYLIESDINLGCARGRAFATKKAKGDYYLFLDNDIVVTPFYLENMLKTLEEDKKTVAVCSKVIYPDLTIQFNGGSLVQDGDADIFNLLDGGKLFWDESVLEKPTTCPWIPGGSTLWKAKYYKLFPIDEKMMGSFEDNEVSRRIVNAGYNIRNCPRAITIHYHMNFKDSQFALREKKYMEGRYNNDRTKAALKRYWNVHKKMFIFNCEEATYGFLDDISRNNIRKFLSK